MPSERWIDFGSAGVGATLSLFLSSLYIKKKQSQPSDKIILKFKQTTEAKKDVWPDIILYRIKSCPFIQCRTMAIWLNIELLKIVPIIQILI